jgi:hypothetical protein
MASGFTMVPVTQNKDYGKGKGGSKPISKGGTSGGKK